MKIFVSVASYCDELLFFTLNDAYRKAANPEHLVFAVVDQNTTSQKTRVDELDFADQIKYVFIHKLETQGVSWARNVACSLYDGEDFFLQIDSHMLFDEGWDRELRHQHNALGDRSSKPIISTYPYGFSFDEEGAPTYKEHTTRYVLVLRPHPETSLEKTSAQLRFRAEHKLSDEPVLGCHVAAGFIFTRGAFIEEVPYDPYLYFHGEEQSLSIRAFTRGWDIFHPNVIPVHHYYKESGTAYTTHHWDKAVDDKRRLNSLYLRARATERLNCLLYGDGLRGSAYGLGGERSLEEFAALSGIDYRNRAITDILAE